jgi:CDP-diglyceride synthetase
MTLSWSGIRSALFGNALRIQATISGLILLCIMPAAFRQGKWEALGTVFATFFGYWACFAMGKVGRLVRHRIVGGQQGFRRGLLGNLGGVVTSIVLSHLIVTLLSWPYRNCKSNQTDEELAYGILLFVAVLSYGLHFPEESWLTPLAWFCPALIV